MEQKKNKKSMKAQIWRCQWHGWLGQQPKESEFNDFVSLGL